MIFQINFDSSCEVCNGVDHELYRYVRLEKFVTEVCHLLDIFIHVSEVQFYMQGQCVGKNCRDRNRKFYGELVPLSMQIAEVSDAAIDVFGPPEILGTEKNVKREGIEWLNNDQERGRPIQWK